MFLETVIFLKLPVFSELLNHLLPKSVLSSHNPKEIRLIARLWLCLSNFQERKFRHSFQDLLHKVCNGELDVELTLYYLFH